MHNRAYLGGLDFVNFHGPRILNSKIDLPRHNVRRQGNAGVVRIEKHKCSRAHWHVDHSTCCPLLSSTPTGNWKAIGSCMHRYVVFSPHTVFSSEYSMSEKANACNSEV